MKKPAPIRISIPTPCHQPWAEMQPNGAGRHCSHCTKTVVDLSHLNDADLHAYMTDPQNAGICARFLDTQLDRKLLPAALPPAHGLGYMARAGMVLLLLAAGTTAFAQAPVAQQPQTSVVDTMKNRTDGGDGKVITGLVLNQLNKPVTHAAVMALKNGQVIAATHTDTNGNYRLHVKTYELIDLYIVSDRYKKIWYENATQNGKRFQMFTAILELKDPFDIHNAVMKTGEAVIERNIIEIPAP